MDYKRNTLVRCFLVAFKKIVDKSIHFFIEELDDTQFGTCERLILEFEFSQFFRFFDDSKYFDKHVFIKSTIKHFNFNIMIQRSSAPIQSKSNHTWYF